MQLRRFRIRTILISVAVIAALIGGSLEYLRLRNLSNKYKYLALIYSGNIQMRLSELSSLKATLAKLEELPNRDGVQIELIAVATDRKRATIAANANIVLIYEHAASHPWEAPPQIVEDTGDVERSPITKRFPAIPAPANPPSS